MWDGIGLLSLLGCHGALVWSAQFRVRVTLVDRQSEEHSRPYSLEPRSCLVASRLSCEDLSCVEGEECTRLCLDVATR